MILVGHSGSDGSGRIGAGAEAGDGLILNLTQTNYGGIYDIMTGELGYVSPAG